MNYANEPINKTYFLETTHGLTLHHYIYDRENQSVQALKGTIIGSTSNQGLQIPPNNDTKHKSLSTKVVAWHTLGDSPYSIWLTSKVYSRRQLHHIFRR